MDAGLGRGGIEAGFGRGMLAGVGRLPCPEAAGLMPNGLLPPERGGRGVDGRAPPEAGWCAAGRAAGLPGRGGTAPGPGLGALGAGGGPGRWRACWALTAASCSALSAAARTSAAATSMSCALAGFMTGGALGIGDLRAGAVGFLGGAGFADTRRSPAGALGAGAAGAGATGVGVTGDGAAGGVDTGAGAEPASKAPRSRRATGASTVLDADFTYSPIS